MTNLAALVIATNLVVTPGTLPADTRAQALAHGHTYTMADGTKRQIGAPVTKRGSRYIIHPQQAPTVRLTRGGKLVLGEPLPQLEDTRPYYKTLVWNELMGTNIEYRAYMPGNTSFFKTELVVP